MHGWKNRETGITMLLAVCLLATVAVGLAIDRYRSVTNVVPGETEEVDLLITEVCAKNTSIVEDGGGKHADYIEIYNRGTNCDLEGFTLSDGKQTSEPFGPTPLASGEYKVLFIGRESTGFSLSASGGETVTLRNRDGMVAAQMTTVSMLEDQVMLWNGTGYELSDSPSPGFPNTNAGRLAFTQGEPDENPSVVVSELLASNRGSLPDENGMFCDAVELCNLTDAPVSLGGYYLSDRKENRFRYALPSVTLPSGGYLVVFCGGETSDSPSSPHAGFGLSAGETLFLTAPSGKYVSVEVPSLPDDCSLSLVNGAYSESPITLGFSNDEAGEIAFLNSRIDADSPLVISELLLAGDGTPVGGMLCDAVEICNRSDAPVDTAGWYLTDNEDPCRYALPARTLASGEYLVLYCDRQSEEGHTGFGLSAGETVRLICPDFRYSEPVTCVFAGDGKSLRREEDGGEVAYRSGEVTIGYANTEDGAKQFAASAATAGLCISEVLASNTRTLRGPYGTCCDWVELVNVSDAPIDLSGWYLSDDPDELRQGALPAQTIAPGEYFVVFLSRTTENLLSGYPVLPFGLSSEGDRLYLTHEDGGTLVVADSVVTPGLPSDVSYGRPQGQEGFSALTEPSPGSANSASAALSETPSALTAQGVYNDVDGLDVRLSGPGEIHYTLDCSEPTVASPVLDGEIHLTESTVVRAICCEPGKEPSRILDLTYLLNEGHTLPVASLVTTPENLWDYYTGIYVEGPGAEAEFPHIGANYWQTWEKEATVSLFETDGGGFTSPCGIRIFGAFSRVLEMKSFSCFFRASYGNSSLDYPLFGEEGLNSYEAFLFRNTGQDYAMARMRDPLLSDLIGSMTDVAVQKNRPVVLYLNGEFWGVYYIREKINENYVAGNYNVEPEQVDLARANGAGSSAYQQLISYVRSHNLAEQEAYDYVASQIDVDEYIDYIISEIYIANIDNGNIKFFRANGGKWTWILYDVDQSFRSAEFDTVSEHLNPNGTGSMDRFSTALINGLLRNSGFREKFLRRFGWQLTNVWAEERVLAAIDSYEQAILPEMERDCEHWNLRFSDWQQEVEGVRTFARRRTEYVISHLKTYFSLSEDDLREYGFPV